MNAHEHLSDDIFIDALYGLSVQVEARVHECPTCAARWNELQEKRAGMALPMNPPSAVLAEQRRNVYRRIEHPSWSERTSGWAAPALAGVAACVLAIGVLVHNPVRPADSGRPATTSQADSAAAPAMVPVAASDTQLYTDVYSMEQSFEPSTSASLGILFEQPASERGLEQQ